MTHLRFHGTYGRRYLFTGRSGADAHVPKGQPGAGQWQRTGGTGREVALPGGGSLRVHPALIGKGYHLEHTNARGETTLHQHLTLTGINAHAKVYGIKEKLTTAHFPGKPSVVHGTRQEATDAHRLWQAIKSRLPVEHADALVAVRHDEQHYHLFEHDARQAAQTLGKAVTTHQLPSGERVAHLTIPKEQMRSAAEMIGKKVFVADQLHADTAHLTRAGDHSSTSVTATTLPARKAKAVADLPVMRDNEQQWTARLLHTPTQANQALQLLHAVGPNATRAQMRVAVIEQNALALNSHAARQLAWNRLSTVYGMDRRDAAFRAMTDALAHTGNAGEQRTILLLMAAHRDRTFRDILAHPIADTLGDAAQGSRASLSTLRLRIMSHLHGIAEDHHTNWSWAQMKQMTSAALARLRSSGVIGHDAQSKGVYGSAPMVRGHPTLQREALIFAAQLHRLGGGGNHNLLNNPYFRSMGIVGSDTSEHALTSHETQFGVKDGTRPLHYRSAGSIREIELPPIPPQ